MPTTVINIADAPRGWRSDSAYVYIGRPGKWGNPFTVGEYGRPGAIHLFKTVTLPTIPVEMIKGQLADKILVCHCKPLACHGDFYCEIANA